MFLEFFDTLPNEKIPLAGGKGGTLAKLRQRNYPVPNGFVLGVDAFTGDQITSQGWEAVRQGVEQLRASGAKAFAVRSSAWSEDSAEASFAGEFETVLDVCTDDEIRAAVETVWASRNSDRVQAYSQAKGIIENHQMAVVVQEMVPADVSGVLFTVDPVSGDRNKMVGNFVEGLGEKLVSGEVNSEMFELVRPTGALNGLSSPFTRQSLSGYARQLFELGTRLEADLDGPQDIEWAIANGQLYVLQSRPITTLRLETETWNDSQLGDYLWTNTNFGEALPDVMTPMTWSLMQTYFQVNRMGIETETLQMGGNIGGRLYMNLTLAATLFSALGFSREKILALAEDAFGAIPKGIEIPVIPVSRWEALKSFVPKAFYRMRLVRRLKKRIPVFVTESPALAERFKLDIRGAQSAGELAGLWESTLRRVLEDTMLMLAAGTSDYKNLSRKLRADLNQLVGEADTNALLSGIQRDGSHLASLGPLVGLTKVARGEMSRAEYTRQYGHRGPSELELSIPTPAEDPAWMEQQLAEIERYPADAMNLLAQKRIQHEEAWARFVEQYPNQAEKVRSRLERLYKAAKTREAVRSEVVRILRVFRAFALKAGVLTGLGEGMFFLSFEEALKILRDPKGSRQSISALIEKRKRTHEGYASLPPYPSVIRGKFEPFEWAAEPARPSDVFVEGESTSTGDRSVLRGFAGSPGVVEGFVRVLDSPCEGHLLQKGEILVANTTNIGWTLLFPRAAAIITDVGAPLSHAAIVARELGIPAVVGTGEATMRLRTGDRVRVHGGQGVVELLCVQGSNWANV